MSYALTNIVGAFLIILLGLIASRIISNIIRKTIKEFEITHVFKKVKLEIIGIQLPIVIKYFTIIISMLFALIVLGISLSAIKVLLFITIIITAIFIMLSFKETIPNLMAGILIKRSKTYRIGRTITIKNIKGKVIKIGILETVIKTDDNEDVHIPNTLLKWY